MLIDTHCHIHNAAEFEHPAEFFIKVPDKKYDTEAILTRAAANDIRKIIVIGTSHEDSLAARDFAAKYSTDELPIYWAYGIHPGEFEKPRPHSTLDFLKKDVMTPLKSANKNPNIVQTTNQPNIVASTNKISNNPQNTSQPNPPIAIGEVGLDYHYGAEAYGNLSISIDEIKQNQFRLLEEMLDLATRNNLPLIFHVREAFPDFFAIINNFTSSKTATEIRPTHSTTTSAPAETSTNTPHGLRGVVHCFTDNKKNLTKALDYGFYIGVDGIATYSTLPLPPLNRTLLETDAPFLAPVPHRHEVNEPAFVRDIAEWLAAQHHVSVEQIAKQTTANADELFFGAATLAARL